MSGLRDPKTQRLWQPGRQERERESMSKSELLLPKPTGMGVSVTECSVPTSNGRWPRSASIIGRGGGGEGEPARRRRLHCFFFFQLGWRGAVVFRGGGRV
jgi:hypothetical protein